MTPLWLQDVFDLPDHLALVTQWANCGDLKSYITSYTQDNVRCGCAPERLSTNVPVRCMIHLMAGAMHHHHRAELRRAVAQLFDRLGFSLLFAGYRRSREGRQVHHAAAADGCALCAQAWLRHIWHQGAARQDHIMQAL